MGFSVDKLSLNDSKMTELAAFSWSDWHERARAVLPSDSWQYLMGGADRENTLRNNLAAYDRVRLVPRRLVDVSRIDTAATAFGRPYRYPFGVAPIGYQQMFHPDGAMATARAAAAVGVPMLASTVTNYAYGEIAAASPTSLPWLQLYPTTDRTVTAKMLDRAMAVGCPVVALTVDVPVLGNRPVQARHILADGAYPSRLGNFEGLLSENRPHDAALTWDFIDWFKARYDVPLLLKGILDPRDAALAVARGADGILVSNHGGRQFDGGVSTLGQLPAIRSAVPSDFWVGLDGGIRSGLDLLKALALGADWVWVGRPYIFGLAANGAAGVEAVLHRFAHELSHAMQLAGAPDLLAVRGLKWEMA